MNIKTCSTVSALNSVMLIELLVGSLANMALKNFERTEKFNLRKGKTTNLAKTHHSTCFCEPSKSFRLHPTWCQSEAFLYASFRDPPISSHQNCLCLKHMKRSLPCKLQTFSLEFLLKSFQTSRRIFLDDLWKTISVAPVSSLEFC